MTSLSAANDPAVQSFLSLELIQRRARSFASLDENRRRESPPGASESRSLRKCYGADGVGAAASIVLVVVDVVVSGVPEGEGASCVVVVSVVVVASFFWQPA